MTQRLAWYDFTFELPEHWEATRYSIAEPSGRFEFMDRNGALGRLSWEHSKRVPDEARTLTEYHRRYLMDHDEDAYQGFAGIKTKRVGEFKVGYRHKDEPCQALLYLPQRKKTLMWVFPSYSESGMTKLWGPILESFAPNDGAWRDWSAFGTTCCLPKGFEIDRAQCRPGDVWLRFQHKNMQRVDMHRWGVPRELLRDSDMEWLARTVLSKHNGRVLTASKSTFRGMESVEVTTETRGTKGFDKLFSSYWKGTGRIWHNVTEKRIYAWFQAGPKKVEPLKEGKVFPQ